jgi:hypothetical protein
MPGAFDEEVFARAQSDERIVLTQDKDFGELAFRSGLPSSCGVVADSSSVALPFSPHRGSSRIDSDARSRPFFHSFFGYRMSNALDI